MKSNDHLAYRTSSNFPLQIASPDSVNAHINDQIRLIAMDQHDWPKVRGRDLTGKNYTVTDTSAIDNLTVETIRLNDNAGGYVGKLVNGKYFFTEDVLNYSPSLDLMFASFTELGMRPVVARAWSLDYCGSWPHLYKLVEEGTGAISQDREWYFPFSGLAELGIDCLADLLAYSYKFVWDAEKKTWVGLTDEHAITMRIRKPWLSHLIQTEYGEGSVVAADHHKLIAFLAKKAEASMTAEEKVAMSSYLTTQVDVADLQRLNVRNSILQSLMEAYRSTKPIKAGDDVRVTDPLFSYVNTLYGEPANAS